MAKQKFTPLENETVLVEAKVGKRIVGIYILLFILCGIFGTAFLVPGIFAYLKQIPKAITIIIFALLFYAAIPLLAGHYVSTKNRRYILTDKRIAILKGGKIKRSNRTLALKSIQGVEKNNNFVYNWFGIATIDFYALAVANNTTKIKILSFSSTNFKFQWVDKNDADEFYGLMQNYLVNGEFPKTPLPPEVQNDFLETDADNE